MYSKNYNYSWFVIILCSENVFTYVLTKYLLILFTVYLTKYFNHVAFYFAIYLGKHSLFKL